MVLYKKNKIRLKAANEGGQRRAINYNFQDMFSAHGEEGQGSTVAGSGGV